jgi:hypothetical protein
MAKQMSRLTPQQIRDAFRTAGYTPEEVEGFATVVERRVAELNDLGKARNGVGDLTSATAGKQRR